MTTLRFGPGVLGILLLAGSGVAGAQEAPSNGAFRYPLRPNESLIEVSRIFQVPVAELVARNGLTDPNRLRAGLVLEIPNAHAERIAALEAERNALRNENAALQSELGARQAAVTSLANEIDELERGTEQLNWQLAATAHWERAAKLGAFFLLAAIAWMLKLGSDRAALGRRLLFLATENDALRTVKEKMRDAVGQIELRFQQLYSGRPGPSPDLVTEGTMRLRRSFDEGARHLDRLVTTLQVEREKGEQILEAEHKMFGWIAHPVREVLARSARG